MACGTGCGCGGDFGRRDFLKVAGLGFIATSLGMPATVMAGPFEATEDVSHFVPADKKLARGWLKTLFERGVKEVFRDNELNTIGMPVGGIGTGQLYLTGEGQLGCWEIFNHNEFRGTGDTSYWPRIPERAVDQGFALVIEQGAERSARPLSRQGFTEVAFTGQYPIGSIGYRDANVPVEVTMEAYSPFIPLNAKDSGLPATVFDIVVKNVSKDPVSVGMLAWLENAICRHNESEVPGLRRSRLVVEKGRTLLLHTAEEPPKPVAESERPAIVLIDFEGESYGDLKAEGDAFGAAPARGTLPGQQEVRGFQGKGFADSFLGGDDSVGTLTSPPFTIDRKFINFLIGGGNFENETCINLIIDGAVVRTAVGQNKEPLEWQSWKVAPLEGKEAHIEIVDRKKGGWGHINVDHIEMADSRRKGPSGPVDALGDFGTMTLAYAGEADAAAAADVFRSFEGPSNTTLATMDEPYAFPERRNACVLSPRGELAPGEGRTYTFVMAWHFPNFAQGHEYAARFASAPEVANYVLDNHERLAADTRKWRDTYYDSTLPYWLLDRLHSTVSYLATGTCQWWQSGRFYAYEGVVCCHGTCTHVWNYAQAHARLFPELARSIREMQDFADWTPAPDGGGFHPDTGLVGFRSDKNYAADGQCGTILKAYREYQMSADDSFLQRNWPRIKKALEFSIAKDGDEDGLIEVTQHNTFDINFEGPNTFVGSLYLAALRAGEEMARDMGDNEFAEKARRIFESGRKLSVERLWDGEYFYQEVDLEKYPKYQYGHGCLSDQLFGQGWAHQLHLGSIYPKPNVRQALESIWKYNWAPDVTAQNQAHKPQRWFVSPGEAGLFTCTWPKSAYLAEGVLYREEVWTGIEYQVAGHMIWEGMVEEALAICRAVHDRYHPLKRNPYNEVECGDHYARAMASWGVFLALSGYKYHGPKGYLAFTPRITPEDFKAAFTTAEGWGSFSQKREGAAQENRLDLRWGTLRLKTLVLPIANEAANGKATVTLAGRTLSTSCEAKHNRMTITMLEECVLNANDVLTVSVA